MERRDVVARAEPHRSPDDRNSSLAKKIAGGLQMREIPQLEGDVMHLDVLADNEIDRVMVGVAAHEHEEVADPVGNAEAEDVAVELGHRPGIMGDEGDMSELQHAGPDDLLTVADIGPFVE